MAMNFCWSEVSRPRNKELFWFTMCGGLKLNLNMGLHSTEIFQMCSENVLSMYLESFRLGRILCSNDFLVFHSIWEIFMKFKMEKY